MNTHATVSGNDWSTLVPPPGATWAPRSLVSVCIPTRNPGRGLVRTLRCLAEQTYPTDLYEVVIADDGSDVPIELPADLPYHASVVRQDRTEGFGAGRARNLAARAAAGDIVFFLDADVIPERQVIESYARWFERTDLAVPMGLCRFVDVDDLTDDALVDLVRTGTMDEHFSGADVDGQAWREKNFAKTDDLRIERIDAFRSTIGATLAVSSMLFADVGGFPELGVRGVEDTAFGYRVHNDGGILILDRDAQHWHQGRRSLSNPIELERINEARAPYVESVIPVPGFRNIDPPAHPPVEVAPVARVRIVGEADRVQSTSASVAADATGNVVLTTDPLGQASDSALLQIELPAGAIWSPLTLERVLHILAQHPVGVIRALVEGSDGDVVTIARTRSLRRAVRERPDADPVAAASDLFGSWWVPADSLALRSPHLLADAGVEEDPTATRAGRALDRLVELLRRAAK